MKTQDEMVGMVREVLGPDYVSLAVARYTLAEDIASQDCRLTCVLCQPASEPPREWSVEGHGVGFIDALFKGLKARLSVEYPSLNTIHFVDFSISGDFSASRARDVNSDVPGSVRLMVSNSHGRVFEFNQQSLSISASSVAAVTNAVQHFVNAELAVLRVRTWIEDARRRNRSQIAEQYVQMLSELVKIASYSEVIEKAHANSGV